MPNRASAPPTVGDACTAVYNAAYLLNEIAPEHAHSSAMRARIADVRAALADLEAALADLEAAIRRAPPTPGVR